MPGIASSFVPSRPGISGQTAPDLGGRLRWLRTAVLDLLFPPRCAGCGRVDWVWCETCQQTLDRLSLPILADPLPPLAAAAATAIHEGVIQRALWALKYENAQALAAPLGDRLAASLRQVGWSVDCVVPVPLHPERRAQRGYNQAELLAQRLAEQMEIVHAPAALTRYRATQSQVGLGRIERLQNVQDAFVADPQRVSGLRLLLVDDVYTTGATLSACAQAALAVGARAVYGLTVSAAHD